MQAADRVRSEAGLDIELPWEVGQAAEKGDLPFLTEWLEGGGHPDAREWDYQATPLMFACTGGSAAAVDLLVKHGAALDLVDQGGATALMCAAGGGFLECVRSLLLAGANANVRDKVGMHALLVAEYNGHTEVVQLVSDYYTPA